MTKKCSKCRKIKNVSEFYNLSRGGYRYVCKPCDNKISYKKRKDGGWKNEKKRQGPGSPHRKLSKKNSQKHRDEMSDMYIKSLITKKSKDLKPDDIPDSLVMAHRENLKLKRKLELTPKLKDSE